MWSAQLLANQRLIGTYQFGMGDEAQKHPGIPETCSVTFFVDLQQERKMTDAGMWSLIEPIQYAHFRSKEE